MKSTKNEHSVSKANASAKLSLALAVIALGILPKFIGLSNQSLWLDELNVVRQISSAAFDSSFFRNLAQEPHPPLYLSAMWLYARIFGTGVVALRLSSAVVGACAIIANYMLIRRRFNAEIAIVSTALFGTCAASVIEAQNVRPYSLLLLLGVISVSLFIDFVRQNGESDRTNSGLWSLLLANAILCSVHYSGLFFAVAEYAVLWKFLVRRTSMSLTIIRGLAIAASIVPSILWLFYSLQFYQPMVTAYQPWHLKDLLSPAREFLAQPTTLVLLALPLAFARGWKIQNIRSFLSTMSPESANLLAVIGIHCALIIAAGLIHPSWMQNKNFFVAFPAAYLLLALVLLNSSIYQSLRGVSFIVVVSALSLINLMITGYPVQAVDFFSPYRDQVREAASLIQSIARPGDTVLFGSVDMNGNHFILVPTRTYIELVAKSIALLRSTDLRTLPIAENQAAREAALRAAITGRESNSALIVDLPHGMQLSTSQATILNDGTVCVIQKQYKLHQVLFAGFSVKSCRQLQQELDP